MYPQIYSSKKSILEQQKRLVNDQKRVMSRLRSSENSIQRSVEESKQQFRKEKKHLSEVINALVRSKQELQLKYDVVLKKIDTNYFNYVKSDLVEHFKEIKTSNIALNRKMLSQLSILDPQTFGKIQSLVIEKTAN